MKTTFRLIAVLLVLTTFSLFTASCMGSFALTGKLYNWNKNLSNKWIASLVLAIFVILPVYGIAALIDWIVLNVIEFYSGNNPVAAGESETVVTQLDGQDVTLTFHAGEGVNFDITAPAADGTIKTMTVRTKGDKVFAQVEQAGKQANLIAAPTEDGGLNLYRDGARTHVDAQDVADTMAEYPVAENLLLQTVAP
ncbi:MAG TPA: DUF3332 family protein [bacterium]|nr:DUF3332 family protein [bacterium]